MWLPSKLSRIKIIKIKKIYDLKVIKSFNTLVHAIKNNFLYKIQQNC